MGRLWVLIFGPPHQRLPNNSSVSVISSRSVNVSRVKIALNSGLTSLGLSLLNVGSVILHYMISFSMLLRFFCSLSLIFSFFFIGNVGIKYLTRSLSPIN